MAVLLFLGGPVTVAGCGSGDEPETGVSSEESTSLTATPSPEETTALEGTWSTGPITVEDMTDVLRASGLGESVRDFKRNAPISGAPTILILEVGDDWDLQGKTKDGQPELIDYDADYSVDDDKVVVNHSEGSNTFQWSVRKGVLRLTWLETTFEGGSAGVPEEAFQRALYMTADFHRKS